MRIRRIKVRNYAGIAEAEVTFPDEGITIVEGPNESGKTSLMDAVDLILDLQDSSNHRRVKQVVPVGKDVGPWVEVEIVAGTYEFTYSKRWARKPETLLVVTKPQREQLSGREAHDRVSEILDEAVDLALWKTLRLVQGEGLAQATFEVSALGRALDAAAGGDVAGDSEDVLWDRIETEFGEYWTPGGKPKNNLSQAEDDLESAQKKSDEAKAHLRDLDDTARDIQRLDETAKTLEAAGVKAAAELTALTKQVDDTATLRRAAERCKTDLERLDLVHAAAQKSHQRRDDLITAHQTAADIFDRVNNEIEQAGPTRKIIIEEAASTKAALAVTRTHWAQAQASFDQAREDTEYLRQLIEIEQMTERMERINQALQQQQEAEKALESFTVDEEHLSAIEEAHLGLTKARAAAGQALPEVVVTALQDLKVTINDTDLDLNHDTDHTPTPQELTRIVVAGVISVSVRAGGEGTATVERLEEASQLYQALCAQAHVADFAEARKQFDARAAALRSLDDAATTLDRDLRDLQPEALSAKIVNLVERTKKHILDRVATSPIPTDHTAAQALGHTAAQLLDDAKAALDTTERVAEKAATKASQLDIEDAGLAGNLSIAKSTADSAGQTLEEARETESDAVLAKEENSASVAAETAKTAYGAAQNELDKADPDSLDALLSNAKAAQERHADNLQKNAERRTELQIRLTHDTERGPARDLDEATTSLEEARAHLERVSMRAAAAQLLHSVFKAHRQKARDRYAQPFREQIENLGRIVYGSGFEVALGDDLSITTRTLAHTTLDFDQLSTGAQEQLGLLARLACAMLVSSEGGAPVIFDDALGWTDPDRLTRMGAAISSAANNCQIIILTCVPDRYANVGNARTVTI
ncbi:MAG: AAA family ATPase [Acidobacteria bacterium]|nr:AAA family ATPase [Acidobacteriota bacterium]